MNIFLKKIHRISVFSLSRRMHAGSKGLAPCGARMGADVMEPAMQRARQLRVRIAKKSPDTREKTLPHLIIGRVSISLHFVTKGLHVAKKSPDTREKMLPHLFTRSNTQGINYYSNYRLHCLER